MLVRDRMSTHPITTTPDASMPDALKVMQGSRVRQLPVLSERGDLVGIVSLVDVFRVLPSPATSLSVWEVGYLVEKIKVADIMTTDVITVSEDTAVEEAGRIMAEGRVSGLPVLRGKDLVGMITESHLFSILLDVFGARQPGVRVEARTPLEKGGLAKLATAVSGLGGHFMSFAESMDQGTITFKAQDVRKEELIKAVEALGYEVLDVRES